MMRPAWFVSEYWFSKTAQRRSGGRARALIPRVLRMGDMPSGLAVGGAGADILMMEGMGGRRAWGAWVAIADGEQLRER